MFCTRFHFTLACCVCLVASTIPIVSFAATPLVPDDPSISGSLLTWLRDANTNYNPVSGVWTDISGNANNASLAPANANVSYVAPSLATAGNSVLFEGNDNDLLQTGSLNGGAGFIDLTVITVYRSPVGIDTVRPVGIGSVTQDIDADPGDNFNLAVDPSIRLDNGNIGTGTYSNAFPHPDDDFFIRVARLDSTSTVVDEWFGFDETDFQEVVSTPGSAFTTSNDLLYLGDVRRGPIDPLTSNAGNFIDFAVAETIVYDTALSNTEITGIAEWLADNTDALLNPEFPQLMIDRTPGSTQGNITLVNNTGNNFNIVGYSIASTSGALSPDSWTTIDGNFDAGGDGSVDPDDNWTVLTPAGPFSFDLSEFESDGGDGGSLANGQSINFGNAWIPNPSESGVEITLNLADGSEITATTEFIGNGGNSLIVGDLDTDGDIDSDDWVIFRGGFADESLAGLPSAISYGSGDLDADGDNDIDDFQIFKNAFITANGQGAFDAVVNNVPEPGALALLLSSVLICCNLSNRSFRSKTLALGCLIALCSTQLTTQKSYAADINWGLPTDIGTLPGNSSDVVFGTVVEAFNAVLPSSPLDDLTVNGVTFTATSDILPGTNAAAVSDFSDTTNGGDAEYDALLSDLEFGGGGNLLTIEIGDGDGDGSVNSGGLLTPGDGYQIQIWFVDSRNTRQVQFGDGNGNAVVLNDQFAIGTFTADATTQTLSIDAIGFGNAHITAYTLLEIEIDLPTLTVNTITGEVTLTNNTSTAFDLDSYQLISESGSLLSDNWDSIQDQDLSGIGFPAGDGTGNGWEEFNNTADSDSLLAEAFLTGSSILNGGTTISLGNVFDTSGTQDLSLILTTPDGVQLPANVEEIASLSADFDGDGDVDADDLTGGPLSWDVRFGADLSGSDFLAWQRELGSSLPASAASAATAVPEPTTIVSLAIAGLLSFSNRRFRGTNANSLAR